MKQFKNIKVAEVIEMLKGGANIYSRRNEFKSGLGNTLYSSRTYEIEDSAGNCFPVHHKTIESLQGNGIIDEKYRLKNVD